MFNYDSRTIFIVGSSLVMEDKKMDLLNTFPLMSLLLSLQGDNNSYIFSFVETGVPG